MHKSNKINGGVNNMTEAKNNNPKACFASAMLQFRTLLKQPKKDATNLFFKSKYATLDIVVAAIDEAAAQCGLSYVQMTQYKDGEFVLVTTIMHTGGETMSGAYVLPAIGKPQDIGSALTYARRYALSAAFGIVADDDDDGNTAVPVIKWPTAEQNAQFKVFKDRLKASQDLEELSTYFKGAWPNIRLLPENLVAELTKIKDEMKQQLGA